MQNSYKTWLLVSMAHRLHFQLIPCLSTGMKILGNTVICLTHIDKTGCLPEVTNHLLHLSYITEWKYMYGASLPLLNIPIFWQSWIYSFTFYCWAKFNTSKCSNSSSLRYHAVNHSYALRVDYGWAALFGTILWWLFTEWNWIFGLITKGPHVNGYIIFIVLT